MFFSQLELCEFDTYKEINKLYHLPGFNDRLLNYLSCNISRTSVRFFLVDLFNNVFNWIFSSVTRVTFIDVLHGVCVFEELLVILFVHKAGYFAFEFYKSIHLYILKIEKILITTISWNKSISWNIFRENNANNLFFRDH